MSLLLFLLALIPCLFASDSAPMTVFQCEDVPCFEKFKSTINTYGPDGATVLAYAIRTGKSELVGPLLNLGADPSIRDADGRNCLHRSLFYKCPGCFEELLPFMKDHLDTGDNQGNTVLHIAAFTGNLPAAKALIENGADLHAQQNSQRVILTAAFAFDAALLEFLADEEAKGGVNAATWQEPNTGQTLLHVVSSYGNIASTKFLLSRGASPNKADLSGRSALHWAIVAAGKVAARGHPGFEPEAVVDALVAAGAVLADDKEGTDPQALAEDLGLVDLALRLKDVPHGSYEPATPKPVSQGHDIFGRQAQIRVERESIPIPRSYKLEDAARVQAARDNFGEVVMDEKEAALRMNREQAAQAYFGEFSRQFAEADAVMGEGQGEAEAKEEL